jgi:carboxylate-amine ligase
LRASSRRSCSGCGSCASKNITFRVYRKELIDENRWRAARYGIDGKMIDFGKTEEMPTRALVRELLEMIGEEIEELGIRKHMKVIEDILRTAPAPTASCASRGQRRRLKAVVDHLIAETKQGLDV